MSSLCAPTQSTRFNLSKLKPNIGSTLPVTEA
jgi:hypothetical protein